MRTRGALARARPVALALVAAVLCARVALAVLLRAYPLVDPARFARPDAGLTVVDRDGAPIRRVRTDGVDRRWVPLREIPPVLVQAVLAAEDRRFYAHDGADRVAMLRACRCAPAAGKRARKA